MNRQLMIVTLLIAALLLAACGAAAPVEEAGVDLEATAPATVDGAAAAATDIVAAAPAGAVAEVETAATGTPAQPVADESAAADVAVAAAVETADTGDPDTAVTGETASVHTTSDLSPAEAAGLAYMREEEKLARDVYQALYARWGLTIFQNIAGSEQTHMDAVKAMLDAYGLDDPAAGNATGAFTDPVLQALHDELVAQGSLSLANALRVGATIEDLDITDLAANAAQTEKADLQRLYENLSQGSRNHLRAFVSTLARQTGETYAPQYLDQAAYDTIVSAASGRGQGRGQGGPPAGRGNNG